MERRAFLAGGVALLTAPASAEAQPPSKVHRIGMLAEGPIDTAARRAEVRVAIDAFSAGLRDHGWIENQNFVFVRRMTEGRRPQPRPRSSG